jgi:hypothetical protein
VDDDEGGGVGGDCRRRSGHRSRDKHGRDGEAGVGVGDGAIGSRRIEHPCGNDERGRSDRFDRSRRWERRVIGGGEGMQGSEEGGGSRKRGGGEVAAVDANRWGRDGDAANCEMIRLPAKEKEKERARASRDVDTVAAMAVAATEGRKEEEEASPSIVTVVGGRQGGGRRTKEPKQWRQRRRRQ